MLVFDQPPPLYIPKQEIIRPATPELIPAPFMGFVGNLGAKRFFVLENHDETIGGTTLTINNIDFLEDDASGLIVVASTWSRSSLNFQCSAVSANGVSLSRSIRAHNANTNYNAELWEGIVSTGGIGSVTITWTQSIVATNTVVMKLLDVSGETAVSSNVTSTEHTLNMDLAGAGVYIACGADPSADGGTSTIVGMDTISGNLRGGFDRWIGSKESVSGTAAQLVVTHANSINTRLVGRAYNYN